MLGVTRRCTTEYRYTGSVVSVGPRSASDNATSSSEKAMTRSAEAPMAGLSSGRITWVSVRQGPAPRSAAAASTSGSNWAALAPTISTTYAPR